MPLRLDFLSSPSSSQRNNLSLNGDTSLNIDQHQDISTPSNGNSSSNNHHHGSSRRLNTNGHHSSSTSEQHVYSAASPRVDMSSSTSHDDARTRSIWDQVRVVMKHHHESVRLEREAVGKERAAVSEERAALEQMRELWDRERRELCARIKLLEEAQDNNRVMPSLNVDGTTSGLDTPTQSQRHHQTTGAAFGSDDAPIDEDRALKGPLGLDNNPTVDEAFIGGMQSRLEDVKLRDELPAAVSSSIAEQRSMTTPSHQENYSIFQAPDDDTQIPLKPTSNFGTPFGYRYPGRDTT